LKILRIYHWAGKKGAYTNNFGSITKEIDTNM